MPESTDSEVAQQILAGTGRQLDAPKNDWYTEDQLAGLGYRREAITELFGQPAQGPDGLVGWTVASVAKIEETRLAPAYDLLQMAFDNKELDDAADTMRTRVSFDRL